MASIYKKTCYTKRPEDGREGKDEVEEMVGAIYRFARLRETGAVGHR